LADLRGELGDRDRQLTLLREILRLQPQDRQVREYLEHMVTPGPRPDEAYAWDAKRFLKQKSAPAAGFNKRTLRDLTVTTVFDNGLSSKFRQVVFQPLTDAAAAFARQYGFTYEADQQQVQLRGARIYRSDGRVDEAVEWGEAAADDPSIAMYTSARTFYVQLPRLEPGDVVELRYRIDDTIPRNPFNDYFGDLEYLQSSEPVANAEYVLITPKSKKLYIDQKVSGLRLETKENERQRIYRFWADQIPPLLAEPAMPPLTEVLGFVHVSTYKTYKDLGRWYWGLVKDQFDLDDETRKLAHKIVDGKTSELDKVKAVYDWVVTNTRYVALEFGIYGYKPRRCVQTVSRGWGDCKDKATVIVTLLKELGVDSTIVVLRTQMRGDFHSQLPSFAPFDHAIVYVPSLNMYLDGTAEFTGSSELPAMDQEALGLRINKGDTELVRLPKADPEKNVERREVLATVEAGGAARLELKYTAGANSASDWRRKYHAEATRRDRVNGDIGRAFAGFEIAPGALGIQTSNLEDIEQPARLEVRGSAPSFARNEGGQLSMPVILPVIPDSSLTAAFASLSERKHDVRLLGFSNVDDKVVIKLPPGYRIVTAPEDASIVGPFGRFSVKVERQPGSFTARTKLALTATRITPKEYAGWRRFCGEVDRAMSPRLVIGQ
jgi:transglutaminase-like putative cysteine protease